ncbi:uncharacterized protein LOC117006310 [Catharus ustulatus]|uniref:uncharacterized protein LOC117006310 n=1 Tax=Catharus ustulatus TaxID=91951 RepID=UPI00140DB3C2|nr:uncharacterized protein LOC117006310 [Catharus ustulatus]
MGAAIKGPSGCYYPSRAWTSGECTRREEMGLEEGWGSSADPGPCVLPLQPGPSPWRERLAQGMTMALLSLILVLVQSLIQYPQPAGDGLDEATHRRMQERQELLDFRRRSHDTSSSDKDQSSCKTVEDVKGKEKEEVAVDVKKGGEKIDVIVEADNSKSGHDIEGSPVAAKEGENDDAIEGNSDVKVKEESDVKSSNYHDLKKDEGWSDGNAPGDNGEGNEDGNGNVAGDPEGQDEGNEGEKKDVQVDQEKNAGNAATMKASNSDDVNEGEDNVNEGEDHVDSKEEYTDVKEQESSDASEKRNSDWTGQENCSNSGNEVDHSGVAETEVENKEVRKEDDSDGSKDGVNVEGSKNEDREEVEEGNVAAREKEGSDGGKEESSSGRIQDREDTRDAGNKEGILLLDRIQWPVEDLERGCSVIAELMESFRRVFVDSVSNSFYPVPQEAIGVGSAFEGWSPGDWDGVYRVLVPLNPPPGHAFHLELNSAGQVAARTFSVHVELVCRCEREQLGEKLLCLLHHSQEELQQKQKRSLLETLCTGSYLDVEKTCRWFRQLVRCSWLRVPQSCSWHLVFQPCIRSCRFELSRGQKSLMVEMLLGVRQGDSDIFVVSQPAEAQKGGSSIFVSSQPTEANFTARTAWAETSAVAEVKFFWHVAGQVPCENLHLKCLQVFTRILRGTGFSSSTWKTVVMHVLTTVPLDRWSRREFARRLWDIMTCLRHCLKSKRLEHFVLGNKKLPAEISLPSAMRGVEPPNLFEHLARDPAAHREAMKAYGQLRFRLWVLLSSR